MIIELLKKEGCPPWVIEHSIAVCAKANEIAKNFDVDENLIKKAALLHDIGRSKTNDIDHAIVGADLAIKHGFPKDISTIIEKHIGSGISKEEAIELGLPAKDYTPLTIEEKIISHADNLTNGSEEVDIDFVANKWKKYEINNVEESIAKLKKTHKELVTNFE